MVNSEVQSQLINGKKKNQPEIFTLCVTNIIYSILIGAASSVPDGLLQEVSITLMDLSKLCIWGLDESVLNFFTS